MGWLLAACSHALRTSYCSPLQEPLPELLKRLVGTAERIDSDVRAHVTAYSEKKASLVAADRRRTGNFMVAALEDLVTPAMLDAAGAEVQVRRPRARVRGGSGG